jgi:cytochrome b subunit of formate dehydrogenase
MSQSLFRLCMSLFVLLSLALPALADNGVAVDPVTCIGCHEDTISTEMYGASVHGANACTSCHTDIVDVERHANGELSPAPVNCVRCHKKESGEHFSSVHMLNDITCSACHFDIHIHTPWQGDKNKVVEKCSTCHDVDTYNASIHGQAVAAGNPDSAACHDCHHLHEVRPVAEPGTYDFGAFHTNVCLGCHADEEMMERNGVFNVAVRTYMASYHGKNYRLGFPELAAGCVDCHTAHAILPHNDPASSLHEDNLVATCGSCHPGATPLFTRFYSHGEHDKDKYPILYWTFVAMTTLLVSTFAIFWIHTLLWMFRGFVENREIQRAMAEGHVHPHMPDGYKQYRRFSRRHIFLHLLVIISFLGLSITGLPLKFADQQWAIVLMNWLGGAANAGLWHRICAVITFVYFGAALAMSFHFLVLNEKVQGRFFVRLFGPDSLMPNLRDVRDVTAMVRWFFFRGPKPTFERWTYWEKFDFLAVFWGMFAIGGSGLMLWFPEFFGGFLPGWVFNVATIVHSDEALLATGFIFTVHFFNTHGRPEKFPMDFVIFNGQMPKYEFLHERGDQWARYEKLGITEDFAVEKPSGVIYDFLLKGFGFLAFFTGIALLALMVYAFLIGGHQV